MYVINSKRFKKKELPEIPKGCAITTNEHPRWNKNDNYYGTNNFKLDFRPSGCLANNYSDLWGFCYLGLEFDIWVKDTTWSHLNGQSLWGTSGWFIQWIGTGLPTPFAKQNCAFAIRACKIYDGVEVPDGTIFQNAYTDGDGNNYNAVKIGTQLWITENLKTTKFQNGNPITLGVNIDDFKYNDDTPLYTFFEYNTKGTTYKNIYGGLYNWYCVINDIVDYDGWNVCTMNNLNTLKFYLLNSKWSDEVITSTNIGRFVKSCRQIDHPLDKHFITTWIIPNDGYIFEFPTAPFHGGIYNYSVDWGDGSDIEYYYDSTPPTHEYALSGECQIKVKGSLPRFAIANGSMKLLLLGVDKWGDVKFKSMEGMFWGVTKNIYIPNILTGHKDVTNMSYMFFNSSFNQDIGDWDVSNVTDMSYMFDTSSFNQDIGNWNVSNVTIMDSMFRDSPFNQDIGDWNVSAVTNMSSMFRDSPFNQDIGDWNVSAVTNMNRMFYNATSFNQDLSWWCVTNISTKPTDFDTNAISWELPRPDWGSCPDKRFITTWEIPSNNYTLTFPVAIYPTGVYDYFIDWGDGSDIEYYYDSTPPTHEYALSGECQIKVKGSLPKFAIANGSMKSLLLGVDNWGDVKFKTMESMFWGVTKNIYIPNILTGHKDVTDMKYMFFYSSFNQDIGDWDVSNVTDMSYMFSHSLFNQDIGNWNVSKVLHMNSMFEYATSFNQDLSKWCVEQIENEPRKFDYGALSWILSRPLWGRLCS